MPLTTRRTFRLSACRNLRCNLRGGPSWIECGHFGGSRSSQGVRAEVGERLPVPTNRASLCGLTSGGPRGRGEERLSFMHTEPCKSDEENLRAFQGRHFLGCFLRGPSPMLGKVEVFAHGAWPCRTVTIHGLSTCRGSSDAVIEISCEPVAACLTTVGHSGPQHKAELCGGSRKRQDAHGRCYLGKASLDGIGRDELGGDSARYCVDVLRSNGVK